MKATLVCPKKALLPRAKGARQAFLSRALTRLYPSAECALEYAGDPFRLLVMARLSAQCTDRRVNEISPALFQRFPDAAAFASAEQAEVEQYIFSTGMYREKARQLIAMSQKLLSDFDGRVPNTQKELLSLPGVGTKIANLMLGDVFGQPAIVADTHMIRLSRRWGFCDSADQHKVEAALEKVTPLSDRADFCHRAVLFGREFCRAQNPLCETCPLFCEEDV